MCESSLEVSLRDAFRYARRQYGVWVISLSMAQSSADAYVMVLQVVHESLLREDQVVLLHSLLSDNAIDKVVRVSS